MQVLPSVESQPFGMPLRVKALCLNFIENGRCHLNGGSCALGTRGAAARNENRECTLHGDFDVWVTDRGLLVTDLGFPPEEPTQSLALGVNETVAMCIASEKSKEVGVPLVTSERRCIRCGASYWMSQHIRTSGLTQNGYTNFCPTCFIHVDRSEVENKLGEQRHWCG